MLRVMLGEVDEESSLASDKVFVIEANLDDTLPLNFEYIIEKLLKEKALDVFINPIVMKKSRPANLLSVITESKYLDNIISTIFNETTTLGVRYYEVKRRKLEREHKLVKTPYGNVRVKIGSLNRQIKTVSPEYEDCKKISLKSNIPLRKVYEVSKDIFSRKHKAKV